MIYSSYEHNHVILPGRRQALEAFLKPGLQGDALQTPTARMPWLGPASTCWRICQGSTGQRHLMRFPSTASKVPVHCPFGQGAYRAAISRSTSARPTPGLPRKSQPRWMRVSKLQGQLFPSKPSCIPLRVRHPLRNSPSIKSPGTSEWAWIRRQSKSSSSSSSISPLLSDSARGEAKQRLSRHRGAVSRRSGTPLQQLQAWPQQ